MLVSASPLPPEKPQQQRPLVLVRATWRSRDLLLNLCNTDREGLYCARSDMLDNAARVLNTLILSISLQHKGCCVKLRKSTTGAVYATPLRVKDIVQRTGLKERTVERALALIGRLGLLGKTRQKKQVEGDSLVVDAVQRKFTERFWTLLGLVKDYRDSVANALRRAKPIKLTNLLHRVAWAGAKARKKLDDIVGDLVSHVSLTPSKFERRREKSATFLSY